MKTAITDKNNLPLMLRVDPDIINVLGVGRVKAYEIAGMKECPKIRFGNSIRIPRDKFIQWIENQGM